MVWVLHILPRAEKQLNKLDRKYQEITYEMLEELESDPKTGNTTKIINELGFRKKAGRVRIKYALDGNLIIVFHIGLRSEKTYKNG